MDGYERLTLQACFCFCSSRTDSLSGPHGQSVRWCVLHFSSRVRPVLDHLCFNLLSRLVSVVARSRTVTTPSEIIPYYRLNHSIWSLNDNKESSR
jgi:hypothetical protein